MVGCDWEGHAVEELPPATVFTGGAGGGGFRIDVGGGGCGWMRFTRGLLPPVVVVAVLRLLGRPDVATFFKLLLLLKLLFC